MVWISLENSFVVTKIFSLIGPLFSVVKNNVIVSKSPGEISLICRFCIVISEVLGWILLIINEQED